VNFAEIEVLQRKQDWPRMAAEMQAAARNLEAGGADCVVLCTNTMHKVADEIQAAVSIPLPSHRRCNREGSESDGNGNRRAAGNAFHHGRRVLPPHMQAKHALQIKTPGCDERELTHKAIYDELCQGLLREETKARFRGIMRKLAQQGAEGIVLVARSWVCF
jgi:aspartate racemase